MLVLSDALFDDRGDTPWTYPPKISPSSLIGLGVRVSASFQIFSMVVIYEYLQRVMNSRIEAKF